MLVDGIDTRCADRSRTVNVTHGVSNAQPSDALRSPRSTLQPIVPNESTANRFGRGLLILSGTPTHNLGADVRLGVRVMESRIELLLTHRPGRPKKRLRILAANSDR